MKLLISGPSIVMTIRNPLLAMEVANKQYVDGLLAQHLTSSAHLNAEQQTLINGITVSHTEINRLAGLTTNIVVALDTKISKSGDVMNGPLTLAADPVSSMQATTKKYVDAIGATATNAVSKSGDTMTGELLLPLVPTNPAAATSKTYVDNLSRSAADGLTDAKTRLELKADKSAVDAHINNANIHVTPKASTIANRLAELNVDPQFVYNATNDINYPLAPKIESKIDVNNGKFSGILQGLVNSEIRLDSDSTHEKSVPTKSYVDSSIKSAIADVSNGLINIPNVLCASLAHTNFTDIESDYYINLHNYSFIVGNNPKGYLKGMEGKLVKIEINNIYGQHVPEDILGRPVAVGDRFMINEFKLLQGSNLQGSGQSIVTVEDATVGAIKFKKYIPKVGDTTTVTSRRSPTSGWKYTYTTEDKGSWLVISTGKDYEFTDGLQTTYSSGSLDTVGIHLASNSGLRIIDQGKIGHGQRPALTVDCDEGLYLAYGRLGINAFGGLKIENNPANDIDGIRIDPEVLKPDPTKVSKAGDTMTGPLLLSADPIAPLHATTKQYVDAIDTKYTTKVNTLTDSVNSKANHEWTANELNRKLNLTGGTIAGFLELDRDPDKATDATRKSYVDSVRNDLTTRVVALETSVAKKGDSVDLGSRIDSKVSKAGDILTGHLTLHDDPTNALHAASKRYVDNMLEGYKPRPALRLATTMEIKATYNNGRDGIGATLTSDINEAIRVDGVDLVAGDTILVKNQHTKAHNGSYVVTQPGSTTTPLILTRTTTLNESSEAKGSYFFISSGNSLKGTGWVVTLDDTKPYVIGTTDLVLVQVRGEDSYVFKDALKVKDNVVSLNIQRGHDRLIDRMSDRLVIDKYNKLDLSVLFPDLAITYRDSDDKIIDTYRDDKGDAVGISYVTFANCIEVDAYGRVAGVFNFRNIRDLGIEDATTFEDVEAEIAKHNLEVNERYLWSMHRH